MNRHQILFNSLMNKGTSKILKLVQKWKKLHTFIVCRQGLLARLIKLAGVTRQWSVALHQTQFVFLWTRIICMTSSFLQVSSVSPKLKQTFQRQRWTPPTGQGNPWRLQELARCPIISFLPISKCSSFPSNLQIWLSSSSVLYLKSNMVHTVTIIKNFTVMLHVINLITKSYSFYFLVSETCFSLIPFFTTLSVIFQKYMLLSSQCRGSHTWKHFVFDQHRQ